MDRDARQPESVARNRWDFARIPRRVGSRFEQSAKTGNVSRLQLRDAQRDLVEARLAGCANERSNALVKRVRFFDDVHPTAPSACASSAVKASSKPSRIVSGGVSTKTSRAPPPVLVM